MNEIKLSEVFYSAQGEGRTVEVPYRGPVETTILDLLGGLRSACTYVGAPSLKQLPKCTTFIRVNRQINDVFLK